MANRGRLSTEAVLQELGLEDDDFDDYDADEPMMPGSDDEFGDLEDEEDNDDKRLTPRQEDNNGQPKKKCCCLVAH